MLNKSSTVLIVFWLTLLIAFGIALFFMRYEKMPITISHELKVPAKPSSHKIIANEFLVLMDPEHLNKLESVLKPLMLEFKMPLLNWLLVGKKEDATQKVVALSDDDAEESRLILSSLLAHPYILDAQHNYVVDATKQPKNWSFASDWQLQDSSEELPWSMNLPAALKINQGSKNMVIAVVDQFSSLGHFTFKERFKDCLNRVEFFAPKVGPALATTPNPFPHGDIILQALGACNDQKPFTSGIDGRASFIAVDQPSLGHAQSFMAALLAGQINICEKSIRPCKSPGTVSVLAKKPDIMLLPFGSDAPDLLQFTTDMIFALRKKNIVVVTSAGNNDTNAQNFFPGGNPDVINVGALNKKGKRASFSNWGPAVDLLAPGDDLLFNFLNGQKNISGTSIAAAYVAGTISLMKSINNTLSQKEIEYLLRKSSYKLTCDQYCLKPTNNDEICDSICCKEWSKNCNLGTLDIKKALELTKNPGRFPPLLNLSDYYVLFLRDKNYPKNILVTNDGGEDTKVIIKASDDNIIIQPKELLLARKNQDKSAQNITVSFSKEPFKRQTSKIELEAYLNNKIVNRTEFYIEYIPKK